MDTQTIETTEKLTTAERRLDRLNLIRERAKALKGARITKGAAKILDEMRDDDDGEEIAGAGKEALGGLLVLEEESEKGDGIAEAGTGLDSDDESEKNTDLISPMMREATP